MTEPRAPAPAAARWLSALVPGAGHALGGEWRRALPLLAAWAALIALLARAVRRGLGAASLDDWVALGTLVVLLVLTWGVALRDLSVSRRAGRADAAERGDSQWAIALRHFRRNRLAVAGLVLIVGFYLIALLAPLLTDLDPIAQQMRTRLSPPSAEHPLGSDGFGRDVLARILYGARISLAIGFVATAVSITIGTIGTTLGAVAGYFGGKVDALVMRFTDLVLAFPRLILLLMIVALFSPSLLVIIVVLGLTQWPSTTRIVRGDVPTCSRR
jgi:peptide/nickel transport system permease protein